MQQKICVMGSFVVDLTGRAPHIPKTGETVIGTGFKMGPGGKGSNQAVAAKRAGGAVTMITKVGNDVFGKMAKDNFAQEGMDTSYIFTDETTETGSALIMVSEKGENSILVVPGACANLTDKDIQQAKPAIESCDWLLTQLETNIPAMIQTLQIAKESGAHTVLNTAPVQPIEDQVYQLVDIVTPNEVEAEILTGIAVNTVEDCRKAADFFFKRGVKQVVITLGSRGCYAHDGKTDQILECMQVKAVDTTGAGDAFNGGFVCALAEGLSFFEAVKFGNAVAGLSVTKFGTAPAMPYRQEVNHLLQQNI